MNNTLTKTSLINSEAFLSVNRLYKKSLLFIYLIIHLGFLFSTCSSSNITRDYDHTHIFSNYKTYRWVNENEMDQNNILTKDLNLNIQIHFIVDQIFKNKNFLLTDQDKVDFVISVHSSKQSKDNPFKFHLWWQPCGYTSVSTYEDNSLVIDIIDNGTELEWRGVSTGFFNSNMDQENLQNDLINVVSLLLENFPPN